MGPPFVTLVETHLTFCKSFPFHINKTIYSGHSVKRAIALQSKKTSLVLSTPLETEEPRFPFKQPKKGTAPSEKDPPSLFFMSKPRVHSP